MIVTLSRAKAAPGINEGHHLECASRGDGSTGPPYTRYA